MNSTVCQIKLVQDEKAQLDSYMRRTALKGAFSIFERLQNAP